MKDFFGLFSEPFNWLTNNPGIISLFGSLVTTFSSIVALYLGLRKTKPKFDCTVISYYNEENKIALTINIRNMSSDEVVLKRTKFNNGRKTQGPNSAIELPACETKISGSDQDGYNTTLIIDSTSFTIYILDKKKKHSIKLKDYLTGKKFKLFIKNVDGNWHVKIN